MAPSAREVALKCLTAGERQGAWPDGFLRNSIRQAGLDRRDAALCTRMTFGVLQTGLLLDWHLDRLSSVPCAKLEPAVRSCLRLGLYQMLCMDRVPVHAAVNESVELAKRNSRNPRIGAFVNAVLRAFQRELETGLPQPEELWVRYSHPEWLVKEFSYTVPEGELEDLLAADNTQPPTQAQVNTLKTTAGELAAELAAAGVTAKAHPWLPDCLELEDTGDLEVLPAFRDGRFYIQDAAARLAVLAAGPRPGMKVLDVCAAPGGKSFACAVAMGDKGSVLSQDLHAHKIKLIRDGAGRLGLTCITARDKDARTVPPEQEGAFDLVIADVPCSGLGVIRKKPDIRYRDPAPLAGLPQVQLGILNSAARCVRPGGTLLYSTCTVLRRENEDVVRAFLEADRDFVPEPFTLPGPAGETDGMVTLWPHRHDTDGFFIAKLRRTD